MSDEIEQETPEAAEAEAAVATEEPPAEEPAADEATGPVAETEEVVVEEFIEEAGTPAEEYDAPAAGPRAREGLATLYLCERGHRTLSVWSEPPTTCHARPTRSGSECGRPVYHSTELPEQVQKALNPLKASKKSSKG